MTWLLLRSRLGVVMMSNDPESGCERNQEPGEECEMQSGGSGAVQCRVMIQIRRFPRMAKGQLSNCDLVRARLTSRMEMEKAAPRDSLLGVLGAGSRLSVSVGGSYPFLPTTRLRLTLLAGDN